MRRLYLIRHAKAVERDRFPGDDRDRPLTDAGERQADGLAAELAGEAPPGRIYTSPTRRCSATVAPLAGVVGVDLAEASWLFEGSDPLGALARLAADEAEVVAACTHGDLVWGVLEWLARGGVDLEPRPDAPKGSVWVLDWPDAPAEGVPVRATYLSPPRSREGGGGVSPGA